MVFRIYPSELEAIAFEASKYPNREVGGDLYGLWSPNGVPVIFLAVGPGNNYSASTAEYEMDIPYMKKCERLLVDTFGLYYLGDWHSHHTLGIEKPSYGDQRRIFSIMANNQFPMMAEIIITHTMASRMQERVNAFVYHNDNIVEQCAIALMAEHESPVRKVLISQRNASFINFIQNRVPISRIDFIRSEAYGLQTGLMKQTFITDQAAYEDDFAHTGADGDKYRLKI